jgi:hypothetical protein
LKRLGEESFSEADQIASVAAGSGTRGELHVHDAIGGTANSLRQSALSQGRDRDTCDCGRQGHRDGHPHE